MPWKECSVMDERLRFVAKLLDGEAMSGLCREFGISRKTGYKIFNRYKESGFEALSDRCRRPVRYANQLPPQIESLIVSCKREKPHWGARKIRELLVRRLDQDVRIPAKSTIHAVLHRHGLVKGIASASLAGDRYRALRRCSGQRFMVRRLQGRVQARQRPVLLSPHRHRPRFPLPAPVRSARVNARRHCDHRLRATIPRARPAVSHPLRQRRTVRQSQCAVQPVQAFRLVAASGHCDRAHQARPSTAKRTS